MEVRKKVAVISPELGYGGIGINALKGIEFLLQEGFSVCAYTNTRSKEGINLCEPEFRVIALRNITPFFDKFDPMFYLSTHLKLRNQRPDRVLRYLPAFYLYLPWINKETPREIVISNGSWIDLILALKDIKGKSISEMILCSPAGKLLIKSEEKLIGNAGSVLAISDFTRDRLVMHYKVDEKKIKVIYNPVDTALYRRRKTDEIKSSAGKKIREFAGGDRIALWVGRPHAIKNPSLLFEIVNEIGDCGVKFVAVGLSSPKKKDLKSDRILFLKDIEGRDMPDIYSLSDFLLITSAYENLPTVLLEAMSCGCIPISTDVGGISEVIKDGVNGFLINPQDKDGFINTITYILNLQEDARNKLQGNARDSIREKFSNEIIKKQYVDIFNKQ
ncbi:MAG: glycosyltransferase family 4 protein [Candidatus Altiarchaeota archaeon]|nr:glycosyltransferase family 4 protein [Candidatus Altiarchaeota archaeon]